MAKQKRQHTIPRSYLASWTDPLTPKGEDPAIWRISRDRTKVFRRSPKKSFTSSDRYTLYLKDGTRDLRVEETLGHIENSFIGVLKAIQQRERLDAGQKAVLCAFTAAMLGRSESPGHLRAKAQAGFHVYASASDRTTLLARIEDDHHLLDNILEL
jgi:hypothetical protein